MNLGSANYEYVCQIIRWRDGDTLDISADLGFRISIRQTVRLYGLNAPEVRSRDREEKTRGLAALVFVCDLAPPGEMVRVRSHKDGEEKFGRWLAEVILADGRVVNDELVKAGHAVPYDGKGPRPKS